MKIIDEIIEKDVLIKNYLDAFELNDNELDYRNINNEDVIFFDIETTGLNVAKTNLYLIGYVYFKDNKWHYCQLFGETIKDEKIILETFKEICKNYKYLIHFNGDHFDIPYLKQKCLDHNIEFYLKDLISIDIYLLVKQYKTHLGLKNCKQKTIEDLVGIKREDKFNGGELIPQYFEYMKTKSKELEYNLLLHNAEDCKGMLEILDVMDYIKLVEFISQGDYVLNLTPSKASEVFKFTITPNNNEIFDNIYLKNFNLRNYKINIENNLFIFNGMLYEGVLKHFFNDYQNYYYIKDEDYAMHKSVAKYLDASKREKAKAANCYVKKGGIFVPIFGMTTDTIFKIDNKDTNNYICFISDNEIKDVNELTKCLKESLKNIKE